MPKPRRPTTLRPPYLKRFEVLYDKIDDYSRFPFSIPMVKSGNCSISFDRKVTIIVGDNGVGKSTILEAIAANCGFNLTGGTRDHMMFSAEPEQLSRVARMAWLPKVTRGFFLRAETFFSFIKSLDGVAGDDAYGSKSLSQRSHGESFLALFENRFGNQGIFILDEPEAALSPQRQIEFLKLLRRMEDSDACQIIIATHSVLLMAYPGAQLLRLKDDGVHPVAFHETPHFQIMDAFFRDPDGFMGDVFAEGD